MRSKGIPKRGQEKIRSGIRKVRPIAIGDPSMSSVPSSAEAAPDTFGERARGVSTRRSRARKLSDVVRGTLGPGRRLGSKINVTISATGASKRNAHAGERGERRNLKRSVRASRTTA